MAKDTCRDCLMKIRQMMCTEKNKYCDVDFCLKKQIEIHNLNKKACAYFKHREVSE